MTENWVAMVGYREDTDNNFEGVIQILKIGTCDPIWDYRAPDVDVFYRIAHNDNQLTAFGYR